MASLPTRVGLSACGCQLHTVFVGFVPTTPFFFADLGTASTAFTSSPSHSLSTGPGTGHLSLWRKLVTSLVVPRCFHVPRREPPTNSLPLTLATLAVSSRSCSRMLLNPSRTRHEVYCIRHVELPEFCCISHVDLDEFCYVCHVHLHEFCCIRHDHVFSPRTPDNFALLPHLCLPLDILRPLPSSSEQRTAYQTCSPACTALGTSHPFAPPEFLWPYPTSFFLSPSSPCPLPLDASFVFISAAFASSLLWDTTPRTSCQGERPCNKPDF